MLKKLTVPLIVLSFIFWSCSEEKPNWPGPDYVAPAGITDLAAGDSTTTSLKLTWTAPGDNGNVGRATAYGVAYFKDTVTDTTWETAQLVRNVPTPGPAGSAESLFVSGLEPNSRYYFNVVAVDEVGNMAPFSNIAEGFTDNDTIPPATITDLTILDSAISFISFSWTAPGDDSMSGTINQYRIRYDTATITEANWDSAKLYSGIVTPETPGSNQTLRITGLNSGTTYYFAVRATDEVNNMSAISNIASATTRPLAAIDDLTVLDPLLKTTTEITLTWTSPGDDSIYTTATSYDIRYMKGAITDTTAFIWSSATQVTGEPTPNISGTPDTFKVAGLKYNTVYTFALKTKDDKGNPSQFSNLYVDSTLWSRFAAPVKFKVGDKPVAIIAADLNNDTHLDLAVANELSNNVTILRNRGLADSLNFITTGTINYRASLHPNSIVAAHLNSDTYLDLAVSNYYKDTVGTSIVYVISVLTNRANAFAQFNAPAKYATGSTVPPSSIISADFSGDGLADLAISNYTRDSVRVMRNNGNATFPAGNMTGYTVGDEPYVILTADFDDDGHSDIASANLYSSDVSILIYNEDSARFDPAVNYSVGSYPYGLTSADYDKDGNIDLAVTNNGSNTVSILMGNGDGTFQAATDYDAGFGPYSIKSGDFDNDTWMDLVITNLTTHNITVLLNDGTGTFPGDNKTGYAAGNDPQDVAVGDFNQDGLNDIATANPASDSVVVLINVTE